MSKGLKDYVMFKQGTHIFAHNFLNIQTIFDPKNVLGS